MSKRSRPDRVLRARSGFGTALVAGISLVLLLGGVPACRRPGGTTDRGAPSASAAASAAVAPITPSAKPPSSLELSGTYVAERAVIEMTRGEGRQVAWDQDDGKEGAGTGKLAVRIDEEGTARGTAEGVLGGQIVRGILDGDTLRLTLVPEVAGQERSFSGVLVAERRGEEFQGDLRASSGDSKLVRRGTATLSRRVSP